MPIPHAPSPWIAPSTDDGRNIDPSLGRLEGEASRVEVNEPDVAFPAPAGAPAFESSRYSYFELPTLKPPVWKAYVPLYFYVGGVTGAAAVLSAAAQQAGRSRGRGLQRLVTKARWVAAVGSGASALLLIADLGRPARFFNMLRVFRPTSPMSMGTWILAPLGALGGLAAVLGRRPLGDAAGLLAGGLGLPMCGYAGVLLASTAVPAWQGARRTLPWLFVASSIASTGAVLELLGPSSERERRVLRRFSLLGTIGELVAGAAMTRELGRGRVGKDLHEGRAGRLWRASTLLSWGALVLWALPRPSRVRRLAGAALSTAAALTTRFAVAAAGDASARDPHATLQPQRARRHARARE